MEEGHHQESLLVYLPTDCIIANKLLLVCKEFHYLPNIKSHLAAASLHNAFDCLGYIDEPSDMYVNGFHFSLKNPSLFENLFEAMFYIKKLAQDLDDFLYNTESARSYVSADVIDPFMKHSICLRARIRLRKSVSHLLG